MNGNAFSTRRGSLYASVPTRRWLWGSGPFPGSRTLSGSRWFPGTGAHPAFPG
jgi:hypothetical protein